jgi:hypothetical protein
MKINKQQRQVLILSGLLAVLAFTLYRWFAGPAGSQGTVPVAVQNLPQAQALDLKDLYLKRNPRRTGLKKETSFRDIDPSLHLEKLEDFDPGSPLNTRNMFSAQAVQERIVTAKDSKPATGGSSASLTPGSQSTAISRPAPSPTVIINLKFFGTKTDLRHENRQGFFADGDEVYLASEGDLVANRYRILRIGDSSAEIEELSSKTRRQITLQ